MTQNHSLLGRTQVARFVFEGGTITESPLKEKKVKRRVLSGLPVAVDLFCALSISNKHCILEKVISREWKSFS